MTMGLFWPRAAWKGLSVLMCPEEGQDGWHGNHQVSIQGAQQGVLWRHHRWLWGRWHPVPVRAMSAGPCQQLRRTSGLTETSPACRSLKSNMGSVSRNQNPAFSPHPAGGQQGWARPALEGIRRKLACPYVSLPVGVPARWSFSALSL